MNPAHSLSTDQLERPHPRLMTYYLLSALVVPPLFPFIILPLCFRYHTLRYRFDAEGVSMRWGILFRREIVLNYARLQDIQLRANFVERWLGLARIELQTAAGSANAEMTLEGFLNCDEIRDFLYERMRGSREATSAQARGTPVGSGESTDDLAVILHEVATELRHVRQLLEQQHQRRNV
jgi:putative membrane protein